MQSTRITRTVRRIQRRQLAILLASFSFTGASAIGWLSADEKMVQTPVSSLDKVPAVRSIGIKLINPNGTSKPIGSTSTLPTPTAATSFAFPVPASTGNSLDLESPSLPNLPNPTSGSTKTPRTVAVLPNSDSTIETKDKTLNAPPAFLAPPLSSNSSIVVPTGKAPEPSSKASTGKVVVKLSPDGPNKPTTTIPTSVTERNSQPVISNSSPQVGPPAKMPALILSSTANKTPVAQGVAIAVNHEPVRISMNDESSETVHSKTRVPELVKTKAAQISTVTVAETSDLVLPDREDSNEKIKSPTNDKAIANVVPPVLHVDEASRTTSSSGIERIDLSKTATTARPSASPVGFVTPLISGEPTKSTSDGHDSATASASSSNRPAFDSKYAQAQPSIAIELESQTATAIDIPGTVKSVVVQNEAICRALHNDHTVSFVGDQSGSTLVLIWTSQSIAPQLIRINVSQPWQKPTSTPGDIRDVRQVVAQAFPSSQLSIITNEDGTMEVSGTTESEEQAVRVMDLVRKLCLVPVKDKVRVSRK